MSVNVFSTKVLIEDTIFMSPSGKGTAILRGHPSHVKVSPFAWQRQYLHFSIILKGQCPDYAHARASSVLSSKDNRTVMSTRQDFLPDRTADRDLLFIFSSDILDFQRSLSSYIKIWLAVRRLIAILSLAGPPRDPKISFRSL